MKIILDVFPALAFLAALWLGDIYAATAVLIASLWIAVLVWLLVYRSVRRTHILVALTATVLGALTLYLHNPLFIKWKPTLVYCAFAGVLAVNYFLARPSLLQKAMGEVFEMPQPLWRRLDLAWALFWLACAALNLFVAYNFSEKTWGTYKIVSAFLLPLLFMAGHFPFIGRYLKHDEKTA